jgi:hypothetical protein
LSVGHFSVVACTYRRENIRSADFCQGQRGPVAPDQLGKTRISVRIDTDILSWTRDQVHALGGG